MISIENVVKKYGNTVAVEIDRLHVPKGTVFGFLGKNGAGKTTTIKMVTGMLRPNNGTIKVNGFDILKDSISAKKLIGYVADKPNVYEKLTGREFAKFMANLYGIKDNDSLDEEISRLLYRLDLEEKADSYIQGYSHGMKQKISLIGALIHKPKLLILDEPTVGLDPQSARQLKDIILEQKESGGTVFLSTHILEVAEKLCDIVAIIDKGHILYTGTITELKDKLGRDTSLEEAFLRITSQAQEEVNGVH